jgi:hypothetical protein
MSALKKIFVLLIVLWCFIAVFRTFYNLSKIYTEERYWFKLTDEEKRGKFFGDEHYFLRFLDAHTIKNTKILFFTNDLKAQYLGRYYLYPEKKIYGEHDTYLWYPNKDIYDYIVIYPANPLLINQAINSSQIKNFKKFATYKGNNGQIGLIYKK